LAASIPPSLAADNSPLGHWAVVQRKQKAHWLTERHFGSRIELPAHLPGNLFTREASGVAVEPGPDQHLSVVPNPLSPQAQVASLNQP
jgi:hypothetical protein